MSGWLEQQKIQSSDIGIEDGFGSSVSIYEDTTVVGAPHYENTSVSGVGAVNVFTVAGSTWTEQQCIQASDKELDDHFGSSVALYDDTIIVGAPEEDTGGTDTGAAYIFTRSGTTWTQQQKIQASDRGLGDGFGSSVTLLNSNLALVGAPYESSYGDHSGSIYAFTLDGTWTEDQCIVSDDIQVGDNFGYSVAAHNITAVVGAPYESEGGTDAGAAYVFTVSGTTWTQEAKLQSDDIEASDLFGCSVSVYYNTVVVGSRGNNTSGSNAGAAYVFTRSGTTWIQQAKIQSLDIQAGDGFGYSVSVRLNTLLVGAPYEDTEGGESGAVYSFERVGTTWIQHKKSTASDADAQAQYGIAVGLYNERAIVGADVESSTLDKAGAAYVLEQIPWGAETKIVSSDLEAYDRFGYNVDVSGDRVVVGAYLEDSNGINAGAAYIFNRSGATCIQQAKIQPSDANSNDSFGYNVAIDGDYAAIGAHLVDGDGTDRGAVYVFTVSGTTWSEQQKLTASDTADEDYFGKSVAISGDTIVVGAEEEDEAGTDAGAVYIYTLSGTTWVEQQKIVASGTENYDRFGVPVAIHEDTIIVGAYKEDTGGDSAGSAYIFTRTDSVWTEQQCIQSSDVISGDYFGFSVDVYADTAIVSAYGQDTGGSQAGAAYIFTRTAGVWTEQQKIQSSDKEASDRFGCSASIHNDTVLVGAYLEDPDGVNSAGSAYTFTRTGTTWTEQQKIVASDSDSGDFFGYSVAIDDGILVVGANYDDEFYENAGAAYVFSYISSIVNEVVSDGITLSGTIGGTKTYAYSVTDDLLINGPSTASGSMSASVSGGFSLVDSIARDTFFNDAASDSFTVTDSSILDITYNGNVTGNIAITDTAVCLATYAKSVTDSVTLSGTSSFEFGAFYDEVVSDGLTITETIDGGVSCVTSASDVVGLTETGLDISGISIKHDAQQAGVGKLISLFSIDLSPITGNSTEIYYFTSDTTSSGTNPFWGGKKYFSIPMELTGAELNGKELARPLLRVGNTASSISNVFIGWTSAYEDMVGAIVTRTRTFDKYLDGEPAADNTACFTPDIYTVSQKTIQNRIMIEWELTGYMDMVGIGVPKRQVLRDSCTHRYRVYDTTTSGFNDDLATCPYRGVYVFKSTGEFAESNAHDQCGKKLSDCKLRHINTENATHIFEQVGTPVGCDTYDVWLDTSSIPAVWKMFDGSGWGGTPKYLPLPTRAFPGISRRGR